jgi:hypothetical protein
MSIETILWQIGIQYAVVITLAPIALAIVFRNDAQMRANFVRLAIASIACVIIAVVAVKAIATPHMDETLNQPTANN